MSMTAPSTATSSACAGNSGRWTPASRDRDALRRRLPLLRRMIRRRLPAGGRRGARPRRALDGAAVADGAHPGGERVRAGDAGGSFVYLDPIAGASPTTGSAKLEDDSELIAAALTATPQPGRAAMAVRLGQVGEVRLRVYGPDGRKRTTVGVGSATYELRIRAQSRGRKHVARFMDRAFDRIVAAPKFESFVEPAVDRGRPGKRWWPPPPAEKRRAACARRRTARR